MKYVDRQKKQTGFTLVELMVATMVFTIMLLAAMASLIQVTRLYYRGITFSKTQEVARSTLEEITQAIQFSSESVRLPTLTPSTPEIVANDPHTGYFCVGTKMYTYAFDRKLTSTNPQEANREKRHVLWVDNDGCIGTTPTPVDLNDANLSGGREVLEENMRITKLTITNSSPGLYTVDISIAYGDNVVLPLVDGRRACRTSGVGIEFCATSELSATVLKRL